MTRPIKTKIADIKRRAILDAAMQEFEAKGPDKASLRAIASAAGMTTGAIYSMFGGKDDLYAALLLESLERLETYVADKVAQAKSPKDALRASVNAERLSNNPRRANQHQLFNLLQKIQRTP